MQILTGNCESPVCGKVIVGAADGSPSIVRWWLPIKAFRSNGLFRSAQTDGRTDRGIGVTRGGTALKCIGRQKTTKTCQSQTWATYSSLTKF